MSLLGPLTLSTEITINRYQGMKDVLDFENYNSNAAKCDCRRRPTRFRFPYSVEPVASGLNTLVQVHLISSAKMFDTACALDADNFKTISKR